MDGKGKVLYTVQGGQKEGTGRVEGYGGYKEATGRVGWVKGGYREVKKSTVGVKVVQQ